MTLGRITTICTLAALLLMIFTPPAHAYLDPGTGSYIFQLLLAAVVGLAFVIKVFWSRIKSFFSRLLSRNQAQIEEDLDE
jgi:hypothetical protein